MSYTAEHCFLRIGSIFFQLASLTPWFLNLFVWFFFGYVVIPSESTVQMDSEIFNTWRLWNISVIQSYLWTLLSPEREVHLDRRNVTEDDFSTLGSMRPLTQICMYLHLTCHQKTLLLFTNLTARHQCSQHGTAIKFNLT
jgi:hypothetical protein